MDLTYTLLADGSSDKALIHIINWTLRKARPGWTFQGQFADLGHLPRPPSDLHEKIRKAIDLYPCDILAIHRDAELRSHFDARLDEIDRNINAATRPNLRLPPHVRIVPIRMQETWLLIDSLAIRMAAGNPNGRQPLLLPPLKHLEDLPESKEVLHSLLREAGGLSARRQRQQPIRIQVHRLAELIQDYSSLRNLTGFQFFEAEVRQVLNSFALNEGRS